ncbi:hypothetical protein BW737_005655 [Actinomyces ruminis]|uniref:UbiC transcription regulator-associated domain-containing protein n=1 Tax=Actinomyces ruminis TaxID=1937003 RepID=A0ABX4MCD4_9ACTO|nr:hypothetical protein BW737_005655 [Actinomyces ruminis]
MDLGKTSLYSHLYEKFGVELVRGHQTIEPALPTAREARLLGQDRSQPVLLLRLTSYSSDGQPIEYCRTVSRAPARGTTWMSHVRDRCSPIRDRLAKERTMNTGKTRPPLKAAAALAAGALVLSGLAGACSTNDGANADTIVVWDYYGSSSPVKPALELFKQEHPDVTIDYQEYDYDTFQNKLAVAVSSGAAPDLATIDMVWTPVYAAQGVLSDISEISQGELNGKPIADQYSKGALEAMDYDGRTIVLPYDFDAYALYYRKDILEQKGLTVPTTHEELLDVVEAMSEDTDGDGKADKYAFQLRPDTFEFSQFLFQEGGALVTEDGTKSAFASPEASGHSTTWADSWTPALSTGGPMRETRVASPASPTNASGCSSTALT